MVAQFAYNTLRFVDEFDEHEIAWLAVICAVVSVFLIVFLIVLRVLYGRRRTARMNKMQGLHSCHLSNNTLR